VLVEVLVEDEHHRVRLGRVAEQQLLEAGLQHVVRERARLRRHAGGAQGDGEEVHKAGAGPEDHGAELRGVGRLFRAEQGDDLEDQEGDQRDVERDHGGDPPLPVLGRLFDRIVELLVPQHDLRQDGLHCGARLGCSAPVQAARELCGQLRVGVAERPAEDHKHPDRDHPVRREGHLEEHDERGDGGASPVVGPERVADELAHEPLRAQRRDQDEARQQHRVGSREGGHDGGSGSDPRAEVPHVCVRCEVETLCLNFL